MTGAGLPPTVSDNFAGAGLPPVVSDGLAGSGLGPTVSDDTGSTFGAFVAACCFLRPGGGGGTLRCLVLLSAVVNLCTFKVGGWGGGRDAVFRFDIVSGVAAPTGSTCEPSLCGLLESELLAGTLSVGVDTFGDDDKGDAAVGRGEGSGEGVATLMGLGVLVFCKLGD